MTKKKEGGARLKKELGNFLFVVPHLCFFLAFFLAPLVYGIVMSLTNWDFVTAPTFTGLNNYYELLFGGGVFFRNFWNGLKNTVLYVIFTLPFLIVLLLVIANALNELRAGSKSFRRGAKVLQAIFYIPSIFSVSMVVLMFRFFFDREFGVLANAFGSDINWQGDQPFTWIAIVLLSLWGGIGGNLIIFLAGMADIPESYYEAARLDGANKWQCFFRITIPMLRFQFVYCLIMTMISCFNVYVQPLMFSGGGPNETTRVMIMYIMDYAFGSGAPMAGMASAMSVLLGLVIFAISAVQYKVMNKEDAL